ncbi:MAG: SGNH/GDSL hydrolase family protein [Acidobacteriota bacterium]|nr:SGNH/GDSL hydrolase family protein [Acidobacteriota bacterium]
MKAMKRFSGFCLLLLLFVVTASAQDGFYLKNGDRVVFYGDSITDQRLYTTFVETYVVTRFPKLDVGFVHSGWGGDRVTGGGGGAVDLRLQRDVLPYRPTVVTVMLGMNDGRYRAFDQQIFNTYAEGYQHIVQKLKSDLPRVRMTLIQASPYDDATRAPTFEGGYNAVLVRYSQFVKELAAKEKLDVADLNTAVVAALKKANATDAANAQKIIPDRVHPGAGGHLLMAAELLKAWKAPAVVTAVEIDAAKASVVRAENTKAADLKSEGALAWTQTDNSLPLPIDMSDAVMALSVKSSDVMDSLNRQMLKITGLTSAKYQLKIDGEAIGEFIREQLSEGVNLAVLPTPMAKQAAVVHALTLKHNNLHFAAWRQVQVPFQDLKSPNAAKAIKAMNALEQEVVAQQRAAAQPKSHRYELTPLN